MKLESQECWREKLAAYYAERERLVSAMIRMELSKQASVGTASLPELVRNPRDQPDVVALVVAECVRHYEARMEELGYEVKSSIPTDYDLTDLCWLDRFLLCYKGYRCDMGVLDAARAAWRLSR